MFSKWRVNLRKWKQFQFFFEKNRRETTRKNIWFDFCEEIRLFSSTKCVWMDKMWVHETKQMTKHTHTQNCCNFIVFSWQVTSPNLWHPPQVESNIRVSLSSSNSHQTVPLASNNNMKTFQTRLGTLSISLRVESHGLGLKSPNSGATGQSQCGTGLGPDKLMEVQLESTRLNSRHSIVIIVLARHKSNNTTINSPTTLPTQMIKLATHITIEHPSLPHYDLQYYQSSIYRSWTILKPYLLYQVHYWKIISLDLELPNLIRFCTSCRAIQMPCTGSTGSQYMFYT